MWWVSGLTLTFHSDLPSDTLVNQHVLNGAKCFKGEFVNKKIDICGNSCPLLMSHCGQSCNFAVVVIKYPLPMTKLAIKHL